MKKLLLLACLFCLGASAQNLSTSGTISAASTANTCTATSCVYYQLPSGATWVTLQIGGTWSGSVGVYSIASQNATYQNLNSQTWTQQANLTANGTWAIAAGNSTFILVQSSSFSSGDANITMTASSTGSPLVNPILAGNLTVSGINQSTASTSGQCWSTQGGVASCGYGPGTVIPISSGGTGATTAAAAAANLVNGNPIAPSTVTSSFVGSGSGLTALPTNTSLYPTLNQNTTGTAANITGVAAIINGGTGAQTASGAIANIINGNNISPSVVTAGSLNVNYLNGTGNSTIAGNLSVGTEGSDYGIEILPNVTSNSIFWLDNYNNSLRISSGGTPGGAPVVVTKGGNMGIGTTSPSTALQVAGTVTATALSGAETVTFAVDAAAGSGAAVSCYTASRNECTSLNGMVQLTTGTSPTTGSLFTISWTTALSYSQNCVVVPGGGASPETAAALQPGINNSSTTSFQVQANQTPLASTQYYFMYVCMN